jgi:antitoxin (DNA-binding transcriptional repressor) of toxin-antitoxin stability system
MAINTNDVVANHLTGKAIIITDHGKPVLEIVPYSEEPDKALKMLRNTVIEYENPTDPFIKAPFCIYKLSERQKNQIALSLTKLTDLLDVRDLEVT